MRKKLAESSPDIRLCPLCEFVSPERKQIIEHLIEKHTDQEAWDYTDNKDGW